MAEEETNSRVSELKARLEAEPGSRVFYQLGEELRKSGHADEAEAVLRQGLEHHSGYLSAWISLGRVLKEMSRYDEALEVLNRAFELDRQNVVVARLLGETYSDTGDHVEAIKKYKLVAALHPADEEVQARIAELAQILRSDDSQSMDGTVEPGEDRASMEPSGPVAESTAPEEPSEDWRESDTGSPPFPEEDAVETAGTVGAAPPPPFDAEDAALFGTEEPASEPALDWQDDVPASNDGADVSRADQSSWEEDTPAAGSEVESDRMPGSDSGDDEDDVVATITMGDLYARQGHVEQARSIYRKILDREPDHDAARGRLELLSDDDSDQGPDLPASESPKEAKVRRLEEWLSKVRS